MTKTFYLNKKIEPNLNLPTILHIDMNGFFASCEQQENYLLRNKPVGVVPYISNGSTILASSYEAKKVGIKTGTKVWEAKKLCPNIILRLADPPKYRYIHNKIMNVLKIFTPNVDAKSIDEAVMEINFSPTTRQQLRSSGREALRAGKLKIKNFKLRRKYHQEYMTKLASSIKEAIKNRVGYYLKCSIGVATNRFLAKVASNIHKPEGFYYLDSKNLDLFYDLIQLEDLYGVGPRIKYRLNKLGIYTPKQFKNASQDLLKVEFKTFGYYWHLRLNGYEIDDYASKRRTVGHSYHIPYDIKITNLDRTSYKKYLKGIILKLTEKTATRLRKYKLKTRCFSFYCYYSDKTSWHKSHRIKSFVDTTDTKLFI